MKSNIKTIAFDADDTLWVNEPYFQEAEKQFCMLFSDVLPQHQVSEQLYRTEMKNLELYGYGIKGFVLCMMETAHNLSEGPALPGISKRVIEIGRELLKRPVELLNGVPETLEKLQVAGYKLVMATKGDLLDQERKLDKSGLQCYFHHIEIMSDKKPLNYQKMLRQLNCEPHNFLMLGNSVKSDILPVLQIGGFAGHIPYDAIWTHEKYEHDMQHERLVELKTIKEILHHLN